MAGGLNALNVVLISAVWMVRAILLNFVKWNTSYDVVQSLDRFRFEDCGRS